MTADLLRTAAVWAAVGVLSVDAAMTAARIVRRCKGERHAR